MYQYVYVSPSAQAPESGDGWNAGPYCGDKGGGEQEFLVIKQTNKEWRLRIKSNLQNNVSSGVRQHLND